MAFNHWVKPTKSAGGAREADSIIPGVKIASLRDSGKDPAEAKAARNTDVQSHLEKRCNGGSVGRK